MVFFSTIWQNYKIFSFEKDNNPITFGYCQCIPLLSIFENNIYIFICNSQIPFKFTNCIFISQLSKLNSELPQEIFITFKFCSIFGHTLFDRIERHCGNTSENSKSKNKEQGSHVAILRTEIKFNAAVKGCTKLDELKCGYCKTSERVERLNDTINAYKKELETLKELTRTEPHADRFTEKTVQEEKR